MLRITDINLSLDHKPDAIPRALSRTLSTPLANIHSWEIRRQAIDARKKTDVRLIYTVDVSVSGEEKIARTIRNVKPAPDESYTPAKPGSEPLRSRPVIVGSGPAGLFAGLTLARAGYRPIILEHGKPVEERCVDVERFWRDGTLEPESNAQFGEGGAGTFSDGKLNTLIGDPRCRAVLQELVDAGAPASILTSNKPHVGTDLLRGVVIAVRTAILRLGGEVRFGARVTGVRLHDNAITGVEINACEELACQVAVLAIGHSARDTFDMLCRQGMAMAPKPFSIGVRIEHQQALIDKAQYGAFAGHPRLGAADYKLAFHAPGGRSAYTFCMCPGGEVIAAASEPGHLVTNGMSLNARNALNGNAALLVNVTPEDFPGTDPLAGFAFQRMWESAAFRLGGETYGAPVQRLGDFMSGKASEAMGAVNPSYRPGVVPSDLRKCLPPYVCDTMRAAVPVFGRRLHGFDMADAVLTGVETRSSCPVRLVRRDDFQSARIGGLYPAGEGAGYAGGIMSAAVDGMRAAEAVIGRFAVA